MMMAGMDDYDATLLDQAAFHAMTVPDSIGDAMREAQADLPPKSDSTDPVTSGFETIHRSLSLHQSCLVKLSAVMGVQASLIERLAKQNAALHARLDAAGL